MLKIHYLRCPWLPIVGGEEAYDQLEDPSLSAHGHQLLSLINHLKIWKFDVSEII